MIALPSTLLKIFLANTLIAALLPSVLYRYNDKLSYNLLLVPIAACFIEAMGISYFYIYSGRAAWEVLSIGIVDISFYLEPLGIIFINLLTGLWLVSTLYTIYHMARIDGKDQARFLTFIGLTIFAALLISLAKNLFTMFIGYELLTLFTIPLVAHHNISRPEVMKYVKILIFTSVGLFLPFVILVNDLAGHNYFILDGILPEGVSDYMLHLLLALMFFGIAKTAIFPLYRWLTAAMIAPYPVSALLHAVAVVKAGIFCIIKIIIYIFGLKKLSLLLGIYNWPLAISTFTLVYASFRAVRTGLVKHVLAYSTIANLSLMMVTIFLLTPESIMASLAHLIAHAFTKITLFFSAGIFYTVTRSNNLSDLRGIAYQSPVAAFFFSIAALSMIGLPPLAGSASKELIWNAILESKYEYILKPALILYVMASIYYLGKLSYLIFAKDGKFTEKTPLSGMKIAAAITSIGIASFPIFDKFMNSLLWTIL